MYFSNEKSVIVQNLSVKPEENRSDDIAHKVVSPETDAKLDDERKTNSEVSSSSSSSSCYSHSSGSDTDTDNTSGE